MSNIAYFEKMSKPNKTQRFIYDWRGDDDNNKIN